MTKEAPTGIWSTAPLTLFNIANNFAIRHHNGRNRTTAPNCTAYLARTTVLPTTFGL